MLCPEAGSWSSEKTANRQASAHTTCNYADDLTEMSLSSRSASSLPDLRARDLNFVLPHEIIPGLRWPSTTLICSSNRPPKKQTKQALVYLNNNSSCSKQSFNQVVIVDHCGSDECEFITTKLRINISVMSNQISLCFFLA